MIVQRIQCYHYNEAFKIPFHSPQFNRLRADSVIVRLDCGPNGRGWGESAPRAYVTGESVASVLTLWEHVFAPILFTHPFDTLEDVEKLLAQLEAACRQNGQWSYHSALGAADLALIDVLRRAGRLEASQLFSREYRQTLRFSVSVPFVDRAVVEKYFPILQARFDQPVFKVLLGTDSEANYRRMELLRRLVGEAGEIRLEVNGKLTRSQVLKEVERVRPFRPVAIEQPLPAGDIEDLRQFRRDSGLAVVVDESLVSLAGAEALLAQEACDIFNIKISKCGGLLRSRAIAQMAEQAGVLCHVGTHVGESELLGAAGRQLARGIPNFDCYGGGSQVLFSRIMEAQTRAQATASLEAACDPVDDPHPAAPEPTFIKHDSACLDLRSPS